MTELEVARNFVYNGHSMSQWNALFIRANHDINFDQYKNDGTPVEGKRMAYNIARQYIFQGKSPKEFEAIYRQAYKDMNNHEPLNENSDSLFLNGTKFLNEALKSNILRDLAKQHGGFRRGKGNTAFTKGGWAEVPLSDITDDMLDMSKGLVKPHGDYNMPDYETTKNGIYFNDGYSIPFKSYDTAENKQTRDLADGLRQKQADRNKRQAYDGAKSYQPQTLGSMRARQTADSLRFGRNTVNHGEEKLKELGDNANWVNSKEWIDYIRSGQDTINRAKNNFYQGKKDGAYNNKTKVYEGNNKNK